LSTKSPRLSDQSQRQGAVRVGIRGFKRYVRIDHALVRPVDAVDLTGDPSRAKRNLGWAPTVTFTVLVCRMVQANRSAPSMRDAEGPAELQQAGGRVGLVP